MGTAARRTVPPASRLMARPKKRRRLTNAREVSSSSEGSTSSYDSSDWTSASSSSEESSSSAGSSDEYSTSDSSSTSGSSSSEESSSDSTSSSDSADSSSDSTASSSDSSASSLPPSWRNKVRANCDILLRQGSTLQGSTERRLAWKKKWRNVPPPLTAKPVKPALRPTPRYGMQPQKREHARRKRSQKEPPPLSAKPVKTALRPKPRSHSQLQPRDSGAVETEPLGNYYHDADDEKEKEDADNSDSVHNPTESNKVWLAMAESPNRVYDATCPTEAMDQTVAFHKEREITPTSKQSSFSAVGDKKDDDVCCDACSFRSCYVPEGMIYCRHCREMHYCSVQCMQWHWKSGGHSKDCDDTRPAEPESFSSQVSNKGVGNTENTTVSTSDLLRLIHEVEHEHDPSSISWERVPPTTKPNPLKATETDGTDGTDKTTNLSPDDAAERHCLRLQAWWRQVSAQYRYSCTKQGSALIQSNWRVCLASREHRLQLKVRADHLQRISSATTVQTAWRMWFAHRGFLLQQKLGAHHLQRISSATAIQTFWRMWFARHKYLLQQKLRTEHLQRISCATVVQTVWRMWRSWHEFLLVKSSCVRLQASWRQVSLRRRSSFVAEAAVSIQSNWRASLIRCQYRLKQEALWSGLQKMKNATTIQTFWRTWVARQKFLLLKIHCARLQTLWRQAIAHSRYRSEMDAIIAIQSKWRAYSTLRQYQSEQALAHKVLQRQEMDAAAAVAIQSKWRAYSTFRRYQSEQALALLVLQRQEIDAAIAIQSKWRAYSTFRRYQSEQELQRQEKEQVLRAEKQLLLENEAARRIQVQYYLHRRRRLMQLQLSAILKLQLAWKKRQNQSTGRSIGVSIEFGSDNVREEPVDSGDENSISVLVLASTSGEARSEKSCNDSDTQESVQGDIDFIEDIRQKPLEGSAGCEVTDGGDTEKEVNQDASVSHPRYGTEDEVIDGTLDSEESDDDTETSSEDCGDSVIPILACVPGAAKSSILGGLDELMDGTLDSEESDDDTETSSEDCGDSVIPILAFVPGAAKSSILGGQDEFEKDIDGAGEGSTGSVKSSKDAVAHYEEGTEHSGALVARGGNERDRGISNHHHHRVANGDDENDDPSHSESNGTFTELDQQRESIFDGIFGDDETSEKEDDGPVLELRTVTARGDDLDDADNDRSHSESGVSYTNVDKRRQSIFNDLFGADDVLENGDDGPILELQNVTATTRSIIPTEKQKVDEPEKNKWNWLTRSKTAADTKATNRSLVTSSSDNRKFEVAATVTSYWKSLAPNKGGSNEPRDQDEMNELGSSLTTIGSSQESSAQLSEIERARLFAANILDKSEAAEEKKKSSLSSVTGWFGAKQSS